MDSNRLFLLIIVVSAVVLAPIFLRVVGFARDVSVVMEYQERMDKITAYNGAASGAYKVLAVRDFYDGVTQGVKILAEAQDGKRNVFWTVYDPLFHEPPSPAYCFFDTLVPGDWIFIALDENGNIRATLYYG